MSRATRSQRVSVYKRSLKTGKTILYYQYFVDGARHRESSGLQLIKENSQADKIKNIETFRIAEAVAARKSTELDAADNGVIIRKENPHIMLIDYTMKTTEHSNNKEWIDSRKNFCAMVREFKNDTRVVDVDRAWFADFVKFLFNRGHKTNTVCGRVNILKAILHQAELDGVIGRRPDFSGLAPTPEPSQRCYLTIEEVRAMAAADFPERLKNPFLFACFTGLRLNDVRTLKWSSIENNVIMLKQHKTRQLVQIPISNNAAKFMPPRTGERVFEDFPTCETWYGKKIKEWAKIAGVEKNVSFHVSRHTFATLCLAAGGADLFTVSKLMGHTKITTTQIYCKVLDEGRRKAVDAIPEL